MCNRDWVKYPAAFGIESGSGLYYCNDKCYLDWRDSICALMLEAIPLTASATRGSVAAVEDSILAIIYAWEAAEVPPGTTFTQEEEEEFEDMYHNNYDLPHDRFEHWCWKVAVHPPRLTGPSWDPVTPSPTITSPSSTSSSEPHPSSAAEYNSEFELMYHAKYDYFHAPYELYLHATKRIPHRLRPAIPSLPLSS